MNYRVILFSFRCVVASLIQQLTRTVGALIKTIKSKLKFLDIIFLFFYFIIIIEAVNMLYRLHSFIENEKEAEKKDNK